MKIQVFNIKSLITVSGLMFSIMLAAQDVPSLPLSIPIYHPMVLNPAHVGSKDYTSIGFTSKVFQNWNSQLLNFHQRMTTSDGYFSKFGIGGYTFLEQLDQSWNTGVAIAGSYHYPVDVANLHNISGGASLKGLFNIPKSSGETSGDSLNSTFNPNMDIGVYYYGPTAFAGLSVTSLFGTGKSKDISYDSEAYVSREYHLWGGYKFLLSRNQGIVLEPSLLVSLNDSAFSEASKHMVPYLKLYMQNFYIGTYIESTDKFALFFQYQFPRFYTGLLLEFPRQDFLNDDNIIFEVTLGMNLGHEGPRFLHYRHW